MIKKLAVAAAVVLGSATAALAQPTNVVQRSGWLGETRTDRMEGWETRILRAVSLDVMRTAFASTRPQLIVGCRLPTLKTPGGLWVAVAFQAHIPRAISSSGHPRQANIRFKFDDAAPTSEKMPLSEHQKNIWIDLDTPTFRKLLTSDKLLVEVSDLEGRPVVEFGLEGLSDRMAEYFGEHCPVPAAPTAPAVTSRKRTK